MAIPNGSGFLQGVNGKMSSQSPLAEDGNWDSIVSS